MFKNKLFGLVAIAAVALPMMGSEAAQAAVMTPIVAAQPDYSNGSHQCLTNAPAYCIDIKDSVYSVGQPVWLYPTSSAKSNAFEGAGRGNSEMKVSVGGPFTDTRLSAGLIGDEVIVLYAMNTTETNLCAAEASGSVQLNACTGTGVLWVVQPHNSGDRLINVAYSDNQRQLEVLTAASTTTGASLHLIPGNSTSWQTWSAIFHPPGCDPEPPCQD